MSCRVVVVDWAAVGNKKGHSNVPRVSFFDMERRG